MKTEDFFLNPQAAVQQDTFIGLDHIGLGAIDIKIDAGQPQRRQARIAAGSDQRAEFFAKNAMTGQVFAVDHQSDHDLTGEEADTDDDVAEQSFMRFFLIGFDGPFAQVVNNQMADGVADRRLDRAIYGFYDAV